MKNFTIKQINNFKKCLAHIIEEALECDDYKRNLDADVELLLNLLR